MNGATLAVDGRVACFLEQGRHFLVMAATERDPIIIYRPVSILDGNREAS